MTYSITLTIVFVVIVAIQSLRLYWAKQDMHTLQQEIDELQQDYDDIYSEGLYWYDTVQEIGQEHGIYNL